MATRALTFYTLCILLCSLHGVVTATTSSLHLTYFAHKTRYGLNKTVLAAASTGQGNLSAVGWGSVIVIENAMKSGSNSNSLLLGSITGTDVVTTIGNAQASYQHIFKQGSKYNGSSLTVIGTIQTPSLLYECIIPGGTGLLRRYSDYGIMNPLLNATFPPLFVFQWDVYITYRK